MTVSVSGSVAAPGREISLLNNSSEQRDTLHVTPETASLFTSLQNPLHHHTSRPDDVLLPVCEASDLRPLSNSPQKTFLENTIMRIISSLNSTQEIRIDVLTRPNKNQEREAFEEPEEPCWTSETVIK